MPKDYDFGGWATRNNIKCKDGRTIMPNAFKSSDGETVPLVWNHQHDSIFNVLGHALLENREDGVYAHCKFNDTEQGKDAKLLIQHGDVTALSIYADSLSQDINKNVYKGMIREVSLVPAGANPGAYIDTVSLSHSADEMDDNFSAVVYTGEGIVLAHSLDKKDDDTNDKKDNDMNNKKDDDVNDKKDDASSGLKAIDEMLSELSKDETDALKAVSMYFLGKEMKLNKKNDDDEEDKSMKHNIFDKEETNTMQVLSHSDIETFMKDSRNKKVTSLKDAFLDTFGADVIAHSIDTTGMDTATGTQTYGFNDPDMLFPDHKTLNNPPGWISRNMDWVNAVLNSVSRTPFSRIKSVFANITEDEARARGYIKGNQKIEEVFTTLRRTTDPQTIYKKQKLDRDDIIDITDFDVVSWIKAEMRVMLNEEIGRAVLIGDGRNAAADDKIKEDHIRPIATDVPLFNIKYNVTVPANADSEVRAKAICKAAIKARKNYKGSGNPTLFTTEDIVTDLLLLEDGIGHRLYKTLPELATALRVSNIVTVEVMENQTVDSKNLLGVIVNPRDYNIGCDKGGEINLFDDFDIDFNQFKYLMETRISGALIRPFSAITLLLNETT